jgi:hypothetical protein
MDAKSVSYNTLLIIFINILLSACSNTPNNNELKKLIAPNDVQVGSEYIIAVSMDDSYMSPDNKCLFVNAGRADKQDSYEVTKLHALKAMGMINVNNETTKEFHNLLGAKIDISFACISNTDKGNKYFEDIKSFWDYKLGTLIIKSIDGVTEPAVDSRGFKVIHVAYTIGVNFDKGIDEKAFRASSYHDMFSEDQARTAILHLDNHGWVVESAGAAN